MKIIGLTGSIAMGKSEVARIFREHGYPVFDADAEVHRLYDSAEGAALIQPFAPEAVVNHKVDRAKLSAIALHDKARLLEIEPVIHAEIRKRQKAFAAHSKEQGATLVILDVPLLLETGADKNVDLTIVVSAPEADQRTRALARPGMTEARLKLILERQMPDSEKRQRASYVIENNGTLAELQQKTRALIARLNKSSDH